MSDIIAENQQLRSLLEAVREDNQRLRVIVSEKRIQVSDDPEYRKTELRIHALGAAISRRDWHAVEQAHAAIRDNFHAGKA